MDDLIKREAMEPSNEVISISSSSSSDYFGFRPDDDDESDVELSPKKKQRKELVLPVGFLDPIRPEKQTGGPNTNMNGAVSRNSRVLVKEEPLESVSKDAVTVKAAVSTVALVPSCRQFWKAGDYEGSGDSGKFSDEDMDHVRVHPKFLHSNATSHKWALGAFAELLDNALDEHCNGATYVQVDMLENMKDNNKMVLVQDNGGGMTPDKMRQCMSLGYSAKSKMANTIGQYGNGFKTSTMRLGADVLVFSRCQGKYGRSSTQTIGLLSFSFLRGTGKEDIVVPMVDFEKKGEKWFKYVKSSPECWQRNLETIVEWSPYETEEDLLQQFNFLSEQGTRIIIYNLWEDEEGSQELDFDIDQDDIQIRGSDRDQKNIDMAAKFTSCRHFLTYRHSLRSYASILYYRIPPGFRIILRGKDVEHHDLVEDLIHINEVVYKPAAYADAKDPNMSAKVTLGFVRDAVHHLDIQGFNVYHKNRLIKPFWRVWSAAGSDGRGVVGVLQANFVEPAHDKQGFERTIALSRLEARLQHFQKNYWSSKCQLIGYAQRRNPKQSTSPEKQASPSVKEGSNSKKNSARRVFYTNVGGAVKSTRKKENGSAAEATPIATLASECVKPCSQYASCSNPPPLSVKPQSERPLDEAAAAASVAYEDESLPNSLSNITDMVLKLKQENISLRQSLKNALQDLSYERDKYKSLENQLEETKSMVVKMDQEQEMFVCAFAEERGRREQEEENLRSRLKDASNTIEALLNKVKMLEAARN